MLKSSPDRYGRIVTTIHWVSALLIFGLIIAGFRAANITDPIAKAALLRIHAPLGIAVLVLTLARVGWWLFFDSKPREKPGTPRFQAVAAKGVHGLLYVAIFGLAGSGIALLAMSGAGAILFSDTPGPLPEFWSFAPRYGHAAMAWLMVTLLLLHIGAAIYHQFILKDQLLARMGVGR